MKLKILKDNNPIMRKRSLSVEMPLSNEDKALLDAMREYLIKGQDEEYAKKHNIKPGVGLAAIQCGYLKRMFVVYIKEESLEADYQLVNPVFLESSVKKAALENGEGCLSVDDEHNGLVHRNYKIKMKAYNALTNEEIVINAVGYLAIVLQHEYDHLNGIFYYDHINKNAPNTQLNNEVII